MPRIWHIPAALLDDKRLLSSHGELHLMMGGILSGRRGVWTRYEGKKQYICQKHDETVAELKIRTGKVHSTPMTFSGTGETYQPTYEDFQKDVLDLIRKWEGEGFKYGTGRIELKVWCDEVSEIFGKKVGP